jgi:hypothetical protein
MRFYGRHQKDVPWQLRSGDATPSQKQGQRQSVKGGATPSPDPQAHQQSQRFKYEDDSIKEWSDALRADDTEARCLQRATGAIWEYGAWRIIISIANDPGKTLEVSKKKKKKKTIRMRYTFENQPEIKEIEIRMEDRVGAILMRLKIVG